MAIIDRIAVNIVVYNEAHRIWNTLQNVAPYVKEIVIVDQNSTDGTVERIHEWERSSFGAPVKVVEDTHWGWCEPSRKKAWEATDAGWILVLDADERITSQFADEMNELENMGYKAARLQRSFWLDGNHRFTGDYQYRFFRKDCVTFLNEIHTEPQPRNIDVKREIYSTPYPAILHEKSWSEQIRDEEAYEQLIPRLDSGESLKRKLELNVHLSLLREKGLTVEQVEAMTHEERVENGLDTA